MAFIVVVKFGANPANDGFVMPFIRETRADAIALRADMLAKGASASAVTRVDLPFALGSAPTPKE